MILILLPAGTYLFLNLNKQVACTTEAKICPDGTSVVRTSPKCEFKACPKTKPLLSPIPTPTCRPRPACLDANPRCLIPETLDMCLKSNTSSPTPDEQGFMENGCAIGGCNNEICQNASNEEIISNCIYKLSYACYKTAKCKKQQNGKCGWIQTAELISCFANTKEN